MRGRHVHREGLHKANEQLLLASELTVESDRAERLAAQAHRVGALAGADPDPDALAAVDDELAALRGDAHEDVAAAIDRARDLLTAYRAATA